MSRRVLVVLARALLPRREVLPPGPHLEADRWWSMDCWPASGAEAQSLQRWGSATVAR